jgi:hypothetical protein
MSLLLRFRVYLINSLNNQQLRNIAIFQGLRFRWLQHMLYRIFLGSKLHALAIIYGTDKWGPHWYAQLYETYFRSLRRKDINLLEIGIGGYEDPKMGGGSLRMWRTYFSRAHIFGIDIYDKHLHNERRIKTFKGSQFDNEFLEQVLREIGRIDIVIDDGSHQNEHVLSTFKYLFPRLSQNGIYVIEDVQTSYWQRFGGSSGDLQRIDTTMGFLKQRVDGLNYAEYETQNYEPDYFDKHIVAIHFFHNIVFIQKGLNDK